MTERQTETEAHRETQKFDHILAVLRTESSSHQLAISCLSGREEIYRSIWDQGQRSTPPLLLRACPDLESIR